MLTSVRITISDNIPILVALMEESYAESRFFLDRSIATASFAALLARPSLGAVWLLYHDDQPAGYIVLTTCFSMEHGGMAGFIDDLFVRPSARRRGLGHAGITALLDECKRRGVLALHVEVDPNNAAANALYYRFGLKLRQDHRQLLTCTLSSTP